ncbi:MAG: UDP-N-acetylglucosamine 2-epimerase (non-hydrolyzing) [Clostridiales bacterium]|nr:UDP-N-acetylglucosamine 2-epimerase (non-hydrolyzing) [Clostridiales bacterium]
MLSVKKTGDKPKVMVVFGTRPDAVKMAPLVLELKKAKELSCEVCVTAQHRQMLDQVLDTFGIVPDFDLNIMQERQTLEQITTKALEGLGKVFAKSKPDIVLVHGDTTTCFAAALAAFYEKTACGHVEAGLRTYYKYSPYPEEMNRKLTGVLADLHFAPTASNRENLLAEGIPDDSIYITGNTVIDALKTTVKKDFVFSNKVLKDFSFADKKVIAVTAHRRENLGEPLENICHALRDIAAKYHDVEIVYAVHLNPSVRDTARCILGDAERVHLIEPLDINDMHNLISRSYLVLTDSGGLQEEAPALGRPVLVLRNETERPEAVAAGTVRLSGTSRLRIVGDASLLIEQPAEYELMARAVNPYGDGGASVRIVAALYYEFGLGATSGYGGIRPPAFSP